MELDVAVKFDKIKIGGDWLVFRPSNIIKGTYDKDSESFDTEFGLVYDDIKYADELSEGIFALPTTMDSLKKVYGKNKTDEQLLTDYMYAVLDNCFIGKVDFEENINKIIQIPFDELKRVLTSEDILDIEESKTEIYLDRKDLEHLKEFKTVEEYKQAIDKYLYALDEIEKEIKESNVSKPLPETKEEKKYKVDKKASKKVTLSELRKEVSSIIINQDRAVNDVTRTIMINQTSKNPSHKSHILITGPSGTGKTKMVDVITKYLDLPYFIADATSYTKEGYVGKSVNSMLEGLLNAADGDLKAAENGILVIDEIDKKVSFGQDDVSGKSVLQSLLKMMDRGVIEVDINDGFNGSKVMFDTSNLTMIFMGAFEDLYKQKEKRVEKTLGFVNPNQTQEDPITKDINRQDIIDYGVPAEFVGRIGMVTSTDKLTEQDLVAILKKSKESPIKEEKEYFQGMGYKIHFTEGFIKEIASRAAKTNTGARNLRSEVKDNIKDVVEQVLNGSEQKSFTIDKNKVKKKVLK